MIFGDPSGFAIEAELDFMPDSPKGTVWGHIRVWLESQPFGRFDEHHCGISGVAEALTSTAERLHLLKLVDFAKLDDQTVWNFLDHKLFVDDDRTVEQVRQDATTWNAFNFLTNWGESFDGYKGFIFCPDSNNARVLAKRVGDADITISAVSVSEIAFKNVLASAREKWARPWISRSLMNCSIDGMPGSYAKIDTETTFLRITWGTERLPIM